tara:strand:- start:1244 stop:1993 length:750 start_codon:yes stop_codon:yes gene_type:complete
MLNFFDNPRDNILGLQALVLACIFIIGAMLYYIGSNTDELHSEINALQNEVNTLELECPKCPEHPKIPACPKCPDVKCPEGGACPQAPQCPDCNCPENDNECPPCPDCSASADCPTVGDIVGGIFPGRNTGVTSGGKYFDVQANESYELLPDYDFYQPVDAFPTDSILEPLRAENVAVPEDAIENSIDNSLVDTSGSRSLNNERTSVNGSLETAESRMAMGFADTPAEQVPETGTNNSNMASATRSLME